MADWSVIETTLETWVGNITGLPTYWRTRPAAPTYADTGYVLLSISGIRTLGLDEVYSEYDSGADAGEEYESWQRGQRVFTLEAQVRCQRTTVDYDAKNYTSLLRDSLRLPVKTIEVINAADIAIDQVLTEVDITELVNSRDMSVAQIDIRFNTKSVTADTPVGYIATITGAAAKDEDGNTLWTGDLVIG